MHINNSKDIHQRFVFETHTFPIMSYPGIVPIISETQLMCFKRHRFTCIDIHLLIFIFQCHFDLATLYGQFESTPYITLHMKHRSQDLNSDLLCFNQKRTFPVTGHIKQSVSLQTNLTLVHREMFRILQRGFPTHIDNRSILECGHQSRLLRVLLHN